MSVRSAGGEAARIARFLRRLPLLAGLDDTDLRNLAAQARRVRVAAGAVLMREGSPADGLYLVLRGRLEVSKTGSGEELLLAHLGPGAFLGEMALLGGAPRSATVRAVRGTELLVIEPAAFRTLLLGSPTAALTVLQAVAGRLAANETVLVKQERLAGLGTLAAGLAHELNNPAAAAAASARQLHEAVAVLERRTLNLGAAAAAVARSWPALEAPAPAPAAAALATHDEEERLAEWLAARGCTDARATAHALGACAWTPELLQPFTDALPREAAAELLDWLGARCGIAVLTRDLLAASRSIADVVAAVGGHVSLDRPGLRDVDLHASLRSALVVTRSRWQPNVTVELDVADALPPVAARAGELSQVWANLIANAAAAMPGGGVLRIRARRRGEQVVVDFCDSGPGISRAVRDRIFEPFFTTRATAGGTGLGLHVVRSIVVQEHGGRVEVRSRPGRTVFRVVLPIRPLAEAA